MICFTMALRAKKNSKNWDNVVKDFNNTLYSIFNQTCDEFEVFVGCNEIPNLFYDFDNRLHFIVVDLPKPNTWEECCRDRMWKLLECARFIRNNFENYSKDGKSVFIFPVDSDDYVNRNIASYVKNHSNANGFKSLNGYRWDKSSKNNIMTITRYYGGTMNIMKLYKNELPIVLPDKGKCFDKDTASKLTEKYPICWYDIECEKKFQLLGRKFYILPFRSTIYVINNGENISNNDPNKKIKNKSDKKIHLGVLIMKINPFNKKFISNRIKKDFGILE